MRWFRRGRRARSGGRAAADINDATARTEDARDADLGSVDFDAVLARLEAGADICARCGRELDGDPDEDISGDAGQPICGECARERDFFVMDIADGELDGRIG